MSEDHTSEDHTIEDDTSEDNGGTPGRGRPPGRTSWRKSAAVAVPGVLAVGAMAVMMAQGAMAATFAVSGTDFKVSSGELRSRGLASYIDVDRSVDGKRHPVSLLAMNDVTLSTICQSTRVKTPLGPVVFRLQAGGDAGPVTASRLVIDGDELTGDSRFGSAQIGRDASSLDSVPGVHGKAGGFGLQVRDVEVSGVKSRAWTATGGDFKLKGMKINLGLDGRECY
ncbi:DUF6230 family protein [Streptomyces marispadix]|uniref:DUF6230 family protein n=1 Tax=Streptomyces marispadix TaxID=2922868 RepID=A0ABS9T0P8_9ACTN|nr:DUF6230 family protein [Streptomyces marispadix]MCH6162008.1 DUF6230 family protein [Streptomyces marispadix]